MTSQPPPSAEARELQLVGNVEFRIAAASTDQKLESLLDKYLTPLLLKLSSEHIAVRNKVRVYHPVGKHLVYPFPPLITLFSS
jgi:proteasome component ECM29